MSARTPDLQVEIAVANMDLYPYDLPDHPSWGSSLEELVPFLEQTGCRNFEIHPTDAIVEDVAQRAQTGDTELVDRVIGSFHQTFNHGNGLFGRLADRRGVSRAEASIADMEAMQAALMRRVCGVVYPDELSEWAQPFQTFAAIQPAAEVYRDYRVRRNGDLLAAMAMLGIRELVPDTVHARRKAADGTAPPAWQDAWPGQFASGRVREMHVSADRTDMKRRDADLAVKSHDEFDAFAGRRWTTACDTELGEMITAAIENWVPPEDVVQAAGGPIVRAVIELPPRPSQFLGRAYQHARFVRNLAEVIASAGAHPLIWGSAA